MCRFTLEGEFDAGLRPGRRATRPGKTERSLMATQALPAELGMRATDFALKDVHGQFTKLADVRGRNGTVVVFQ